MPTIEGPPRAATRNQPIAPELRAILLAAGDAAGIDHITISSGGQPAAGEGRRRTGSTRHDHGRAADLQLWIGGRALTFTDAAAPRAVLDFVTQAAARGATGIGAGVRYMGNRTLHIGFGLSRTDRTRLTWGEQGASVNAPGWLRSAAQHGWEDPVVDAEPGDEEGPIGDGRRFEVIARSGLKLRPLPGTQADALRTLPLGTVVTVTGYIGDWAQVDVEGDGLRDGYVFAEYLAPVDGWAGEAVPEPDDVYA